MKVLVFFIISFISLGLFTGCSFDYKTQSSETISVVFPDWPPDDPLHNKYPPLSRWKVTVCSAEQVRTYYTQEFHSEINIKKNRPFCITVHPITLMQDNKESDFFKPAGYIYPWNNNEKNLATWEQGFLADLMIKIIKDGRANSISPADTEFLISTYNWNKAQQIINKKLLESSEMIESNNSKKPFYNPWLLDSSEILSGISSKEFKTALLNLKSCYTISQDTIFNNYESDDSKNKAALFSAFIPENEFIYKSKRLSVKKATPLLFTLCDYNIAGVYIDYISTKNISLEFIFLPIYIEDI